LKPPLRDATGDRLSREAELPEWHSYAEHGNELQQL
jgi:hypothetical protein